MLTCVHMLMLMHMHMHAFLMLFPCLVYATSAGQEFKSDNQTVIIVFELV